ncbi:YraN family protein [Acidobacteriota bacterium]
MISHELGRSGERTAEIFLRKLGYSILEKGFRFLRGEIDIIAREADCIVFVEVKTRSEEEFGFAEESIGQEKQKQIRKTAEGYLFLNSFQDRECRFDVISVITDKNKDFLIRHFKNAFE